MNIKQKYNIKLQHHKNTIQNTIQKIRQGEIREGKFKEGKYSTKNIIQKI